MIFTARQLQEKCQEQNVDLYMTSVDFTKAFDTVSHDGHWKIMAEFGCPPGRKLKVFDKFTYLGNTHSRTVHIDDEVTARIA